MIKKNIVILICTVLSLNVSSQDLINSYLNYQTNGLLYPPQFITLGSGSYTFNHDLTDHIVGPPYYYGEFEISLKHHFWFTDQLFAQYDKAYSYEVVSFPFMNDCAFTNNGCVEPLPISNHSRSLFVPKTTTSTYDPINNYWEINGFTSKLYRKTPLRNFINEYSSGSSSGTTANTLVSLMFRGANASDRQIIPHTILKVTIYLMCGTSIVSSFDFLYDNTRGQMRKYPFYPYNMTVGGNPAFHDLIFVPKLILNTNIDHIYNNTAAPDLIAPMGALNYFDVNSNFLLEDCSNNFFVPSQNDMFRELPNIFHNIFPSPYTLLSSSLRSASGQFLAGYDYNSSGVFGKLEGIMIEFNIDQNIDLNLINPTEKIIYNPSEVNVSANDLIFPEGYTFKTIRGVYPSESLATLDNLPENGGPFNSTLEVPIRTDLGSENITDPQNNNLYASRYYMKPGSKLTIQKCVKLYDATFDLEQGSTIIIDDYSQLIGLEDKSYQNGRIKFQNLNGGAILRNNSVNQFVQNGIITQPYLLHYIASDLIVSGSNVDIDQDALIGDYIIENGADVVFESGREIRLKPGFRAKSGSKFIATIKDFVALPVCFSVSRIGIDNKAVEKHHLNFEDYDVYPNPSNGTIILSLEKFSKQECDVFLYNNIGEKIYSQKVSFIDRLELDFQNQPRGVYLLVLSVSNETITKKIVLQ